MEAVKIPPATRGGATASFIFRHRFRFGLVLVVILYLFNGVQYLQQQSITFDENGFYLYAKRWARGQPERVTPVVDNSKMPVVALNLLPRAAEQWLRPETHKTDNGDADIRSGRYVTLAFSLLAIGLVFRWGTEWFGAAAGLLAAFLLSFSPDFIAAAGLVTTDAYSTVFLLAAIYFFQRSLSTRRLGDFIWFSIVVAAAQLVKQSLFHLYLLLPVMWVLICCCIPEFRRPFRTTLGRLLLFCFIQWIVINAGYYFSGSNHLLGSYHFMSHFFQAVQRSLPTKLPVPFPKPFVDGLDMTKYYDQLGGGYDPQSSFGKVTILGRSSRGGHFWYYYFVSLFFKAPVTMMILFLASVLATLRCKNNMDLVRVIFLLAPAIYFLLIMDFFYNTQVGVRHIVFLIPGACIFISSLIPLCKGGIPKAALVLLLLYLVASVSVYRGNFFPYSNEFITDKSFAWRKLGGANLDFNQGNKFAERFLTEHPEVHRSQNPPRAGKYLVSINDYLNVWDKPEFMWMKSGTVYGQVGFSNLLIEYKPEGRPE